MGIPETNVKERMARDRAEDEETETIQAEQVCDLSVVVITRNEEENIQDCLKSILQALRKAAESDLISSWEIIVSDSASKDSTIEVASRFPVGIVRLSDDWPLSAGAGRAAGYSVSSGESILFLDGDCIIHEDWLLASLRALSPDDVAGVDGNLAHIVSDSNFFFPILKEIRKSQFVSSLTEVETLGQAVFKRGALEKVGGYNPFLKGGEDRDLAYRLRREGYRLLRVPKVNVDHYWAGKKGDLKYYDVVKSSFFWSFGDGQATRWSFSDASIRGQQRSRYLRSGELKGVLPTLLLLMLLAANLLLPFSRNTLIWVGVLLLDLVFLITVTLTSRGKSWGMRRTIYETFQTTPYLVVRLPSFVLGFLKGSKDPKLYPPLASENIIRSPPILAA